MFFFKTFKFIIPAFLAILSLVAADDIPDDPCFQTWFPRLTRPGDGNF
jgi:hypothetical protein